MNAIKKKKLESAGFKVGGVQEFLSLSDDEMALIDLKARLIRMLRPAREAAGISQEELARRIGSSQSRVAKLEAASRQPGCEPRSNLQGAAGDGDHPSGHCKSDRRDARGVRTQTALPGLGGSTKWHGKRMTR
jgi:hypothetical protein